MKTIAVILAGGSGTRLGGNLPKQFLEVNDKMIITYTLEAFQNHELIDEIVIVCSQEHFNFVESEIKGHFNKLQKVVTGGQERYHSSLAAISACDDGEEKKILIHDGVRPLVKKEIISNCITKLDTYNAVGVGIATTDTIWSVKDNCIASIPDRRTIYRAQTPQGFKLSTIKEAYKIALKDKNMLSTDDCGVVMHYLPDEKISTVMGDEKNIKITRKEDLVLFESIIKKEEWNK